MRDVFPVREKWGNFKISPKSQEILGQSGKVGSKYNTNKKNIFYIQGIKIVAVDTYLQKKLTPHTYRKNVNP